MSESTDRRPQTVRRILAPRVDCTYVANEAAAFALGALEPVERVNVERHIRTCDDCAALVADLEATAGLLPFASPPATPPPAAKSALFARIAEAERVPVRAQPRSQPQPQLQPKPVVRAPHVAPLPTMLTLPASGLDVPATPAQPVVPAAPPKRWYAVGAPLATIPLVLALALVSVWSFSLRDQAQPRSQPSTESVGENLNPERSETTGAEIDTGEGGVESVLGLDELLDSSSLNAVDAGDEGDLDADADVLGAGYGGVAVGVASGATVNSPLLQIGGLQAPTGGEVPIG